MFTYICWLHLKGFNYTFVGVREDELSKVLNKEKKDKEKEDRKIQPVSWVFETKLERLDLLYIVHYPDPEKKGDHCRRFGGYVVEDVKGSC